MRAWWVELPSDVDDTGKMFALPTINVPVYCGASGDFAQSQVVRGRRRTREAAFREVPRLGYKDLTFWCDNIFTTVRKLHQNAVWQAFCPEIMVTRSTQNHIGSQIRVRAMTEVQGLDGHEENYRSL